MTTNLPRVGDKIASWMQLAGHCYRHPELEAHTVIPRKPIHGLRKRGRSKISYTGVLQKDKSVESTDKLATFMQDRITWKSHTRACMWVTE